MGENLVHKDQPSLLSFSSPLIGTEKILAVLADGNVGVHAAAVHADNGLGRKLAVRPMCVATWRTDQFES